MAISYAKHGFNNLTYARLCEYTASSAVVLRLIHGYVANLLQGWASGRNMFVTLRDVEGNIEVCKITDIQGDNLTVARGQDGTIARNWPAGTLVAQRSVADSLGRFIQKGEYRTVEYNPNGVIAGLYPGEKIYETGADACQKRWWLFNESTKWRLLAGEKCSWEIYDGDGYIQSPNFWEPWGSAICDNNDWGYIMFWDHINAPIEQDCNISTPPFPAGLWTLSGGTFKHDWLNALTNEVTDDSFRCYDPGTVNNIKTLIIGISATLTPSTDPGIGGDTTKVRLVVSATGGSCYFSIASIDWDANFIGTGFLEINLSDYGVSGNLQNIGFTTRVHWKGARAVWECFYLGVF